MKSDFRSSASYTFLNVLGNLLLPGSAAPFVPRWDAEEPSQQFLSEVAKLHLEIEAFRDLLTTKTSPYIDELKEEDVQACIAENSPTARNFFQTVGDLYIHEYYSRPQILLALGLSIEPPFPKGNKIKSGNLEILEAVFTRGKKNW